MNAETRESTSGGMMALKVNPENWKWLLTLGIILILLGSFAIVFPLGASVGIALFLGIILVISGGAYLVYAIATHKHGFIWQLLMALVYLVVGIMLIVYPLTGVVTLTLLLGINFLVAGTFKSITALMSRTTRGWGMMLVSGLLSVIIGLLILANWPSSSEWVIGLLVGIDLVFGGMTLTTLAMEAHSGGGRMAVA